MTDKEKAEESITKEEGPKDNPPFKVPISTDENKTSFDALLKEKNNMRIFFSAPFGMGKTCFLEEFFKRNSDAYSVFHLYPVKYQIRGDIDMVEVIGADLFRQLSEDEVCENVINNLLKEKDFERKLQYTARLLFKCLGSIVGVPPNTIDVVSNFLKNNEAKKIQENLVSIQHSNFFEDLVRQILNKLKEESSRKSILILDDLDRFEPRHIFKLLNAFSPLHDHEGNEYGFDKVIFVGDIDNIKKIFHHIYGKDTDFNGYIDKFFSGEPYRFHIEEGLRLAIPRIISKYHSKGLEKPDVPMLFFVLMFALRMKKINLRNLFMPSVVTIQAFESFADGQGEMRNSQVSTAVKILLAVFMNDKERLLAFIKNDLEPIFKDKTVGYMSIFSGRGIEEVVHNLRDPGASMLHGTMHFKNPPRFGENFTDQWQNQFRKFHDRFSFKSRDDYFTAGAAFLEVLCEYIELDVYR